MGEEPVLVEEEASVSSNPYALENLSGGLVVGDFVVGPGKIETTIKPGETKVVELTVSNRIGETREFKLEIEDFTGSSDPEKPVVLLGADHGPYTLKDYISFPQTAFELGHSMRARIPVTISVPANAAPGGHYGSVLVSTVTRSSQSEGLENAAPTSVIQSRIGTLFFITVPGDVEKNGELTDFTVIPDALWHESGPIDFGLTYENTGSIHTNPYGEIRIKNMLGKEVAFIEVEPWFSLPQSLRLREVAWGRTFLVGRYSAVAEINRGYDDIIDTKELVFWVLPWKVVLVTFVGLFLIIFIFRSFFKRFEFKRKE